MPQIKPRKLSPGEVSYNRRVQAWYRKQQARKSPVPAGNYRKTAFNTGIVAPKRMEYGAVWSDDNM